MNTISRGAATELLEAARWIIAHNLVHPSDLEGKALQRAITRVETELAAPGPPPPEDDDTTRAARAAVKLFHGMGLTDTIRNRLLDALDAYHGAHRATITVDVRGGRVENVENVPPGVTVRTRDYDTDGVYDGEPDVEQDTDGSFFILREWAGPSH